MFPLAIEEGNDAPPLPNNLRQKLIQPRSTPICQAVKAKPVPVILQTDGVDQRLAVSPLRWFTRSSRS